MKPRVSVIVPLYDSAGTIAATLDSLLAQSLREWECVIVNDGSRDEGPAIARGYGAADGRFRVVDQPNRGLAAARNTGLDHARAEYIHFLDADDLITPEALERLHACATISPHRCAASGYQRIRADGAPIGCAFRPLGPDYGFDELLTHNPVVVHALLMHRSHFESQRFDESLPVLEDHDLWLRLAETGVRWSVIDEALALYRQRPDGLSRDTTRMWAAARRVIPRAYASAGERWREAIDLSPARRDATLIRHALVLAGTDPRAAAEMLNESPELRPDPVALVDTLAGSLQEGADALDPSEQDHLPQSIASAMSRWAHVFRERGLFSLAQSRVAISRVASLSVDPSEIVGRLLRGLRPGAEIAFIGAGRNAHRLADALSAQGRPFVVFDDNPAAARRLADRHAVRTATLNECHSADHLIVTPLDDGPLLMRLPRHPGLHRWSVAFEQARREVEDGLLREILPVRPAA